MIGSTEPQSAERSRRTFVGGFIDVTRLIAEVSEPFSRREFVALSWHDCHVSERAGGARRWRGKEVNRMQAYLGYWVDRLNSLKTREDGQTMAEYGVVLAVIALGVVVALGLLSDSISGAIERVLPFLG
jgi:Flp pilus assembly pilin Flp